MQTIRLSQQAAHTPRGFAALSVERRKEIASLGGKASLNRYKWTSEQAREAGRKGGLARTRRDRQVSHD